MFGTRERIIADERYHTCGRCKWDETPDEMYPCNQCVHGTDTRKDFWEYAEEEPFINKPCVSEQACREDKMKVLEKIRAEIERRGGNDNKAFCKSLNESYKLGLREAIEIIDKHGRK